MRSPSKALVTDGCALLTLARIGKGILTYSQSSNILTPEFADQSERYSSSKQFYPLLFKEADIAAAVVSTTELRAQKP
ncbi:MAG: hypothetical protein ACRDBI_10725 [Shewanella sp.]